MSDEPVIIATFDLGGSAHILRAKLGAHDIDAYVIDENIATMFWHYNWMTMGAKLQVRQSDTPEALQIIREKCRDQSFAESVSSEIRCPQCNSDNIYFQKASRGWAMLGFVIFRFPIPIPKRKWICSDCRHQWKHRQAKQSQSESGWNS